MKNSDNLKNRPLVLLAVLVAIFSAPLLADGFIVIPHPPRPGPDSLFPLEVIRHSVNVEITEQLATTTVDQEFFNPNAARLEGYYLFPLPAGAVISNFSMWIDGRETRAELLDAAKARNIYEDIVRRLRDPALLEYGDRGVFKMRVFPIEPHGKKRIKISYHEVLEKSNGSIAYLYPLGTEKFSAKAIPEVSIIMNILSSAPLAGIYCPTHPVKIERTAAERARVSYVSRNSLPDTDFKVFITPASGRFGFSMLTFRPPDQDGTFFLNLSPSPFRADNELNAKDITFVVDTSGSMAGRNLEQAKNALLYCLNRLNRDDRFNVIRFATDAESLFQELRTAGVENLRQARNFIGQWQAGGGTNCEEALKLTLTATTASERPRLAVLITDGKPTIGETDEDALLKIVASASIKNLRLFPVAIGSDINTHLLDKLAEQTRTFRTYLSAGEGIETGIARFYDKIQSPVLSAVRLNFPKNIRTGQIYPRELPDLYLGSALSVIGRYQGSGRGIIEIQGLINGRSQTLTFSADFAAQSLKNDFLPSLWAARRVGFLLDQIRLHGENKELVDEVTSLARLYGIVTPYTSYLIVEDEKIRRDRGDLADSDMTLGRIAAASPGFAQKQREEFSRMKDDKSGGSGVQISSELQKLNQAQAVAETRSGENRLSYRDHGDREQNLGRQVKNVAGRTLYFSGAMWVDASVQGLSSLPVMRIAFASEKYFELLRREPAVKTFLALGRNIKFVLRQQIIEIY